MGVKILVGIFCMMCATQATVVQWYSGSMGVVATASDQGSMVQWFNGVSQQRQVT
jgi:hypothetical protein